MNTAHATRQQSHVDLQSLRLQSGEPTVWRLLSAPVYVPLADTCRGVLGAIIDQPHWEHGPI